MSDNVPPHEIQMEIIKKVTDVKTLIRFRSVSKPWKSFIDDPKFIAGYGARPTQPHRLLLRYKETRWPFDLKYVSLYNETFPSEQDVAPSLLIKQLKSSKVIGNSCGLWCLHGYIDSRTERSVIVVIWNPSIRKSVGIPVPRVLNTNSEVTEFGFGVCPLTNDPTIVGISFQREYKPNILSSVAIFTLSSNTWKMLPSSNLPRGSISFQNSTQVAIDRFIFWLAYDRIVGNDGELELKKLILSFDLITQEFKEVHLPVGIANQVSLISLCEINESIVVSSSKYDVNGGIMHGVWMMGVASGVLTSFTKLFNFKTPFDLSISMLFGFTKRSEPIMETLTNDTRFSKIEVYEPYSKHLNDLGITGILGSFYICPYTETLLLVDHSDVSIISNDC